MTLVIARKYQQKISLVSDSRLDFDGASKFDFCIKVSSVSVKIFGPYDKNLHREVVF